MARGYDDTQDDGGGWEDPYPIDEWGRLPSDPWYGIPPGTGGHVPYAPGQGPDPEDEPIPEQPPPPPPPPPPGPTPTSTTSSGTPTSFQVSESWPTFTPPPLPTIAPFQRPNPYEYTPFAEPDPFTYDAFAAPTLDEARQEPGYEFAQQEGLRALQNSAAAKGTLRTGGTLKELINWGNKLGEQNYGNVYNRAANTYGINRGNAFENYQTNRGNRFQSHQANELGKLGAWNTNFGADKDVYDRNTQTTIDLYDRNFQGELAKFNPQFRAAELTFSDIYNRWRDQLNALTNITTAGAMS